LIVKAATIKHGNASLQQSADQGELPMTKPPHEYVVPTPEGGWRINGTRISLDSVVHAYRAGTSPETIVAEYPSLSLEQVHGALAFYLRHREEIDAYLTAQDQLWAEFQQTSETANAELLGRIRAARKAPTPADASA
jgi:uncharacterized protein (DUF433 family)